MYLQAKSARTKYPNTSDSDASSEVMHIVQYSVPDGENKSIEIMAEDPMDAIQKVNRMTLNDLHLHKFKIN